MLRTIQFKWILSLLIPVGVYFAVHAAVQANPSLDPHLPVFFAITLWAITVWATDILPAVPSAAAMTFLYVICDVAPPPRDFRAVGELPALALPRPAGRSFLLTPLRSSSFRM